LSAFFFFDVYAFLKLTPAVTQSSKFRFLKPTPHALNLSITIKNNMDIKGSAAFSAIIVGARRFLSMKLCGAAGAKAGSDS